MRRLRRSWMKIKITMKTNPKQILKLFRECKDTESVNLETLRGHIFMAGGMLCKLEDDKHYFAHGGKWVLV